MAIFAGLLPTRRVASRAVRAELTVVGVVALMAGNTLLRRAFIDIVRMALPTTRGKMDARERKSGLGMVKSRRFPAFRRVAGRAVRTKLAGVGLIGLMAKNAIVLRYALKDVSRVALSAVYQNMRSDERKSGSAVREHCIA